MPKTKMNTVFLGRFGMFFSILVLFMAVLSCSDRPKVANEIAAIPVDFQVIRFDQEFGRAIPGDIPALKKKYPYLFPVKYTDSVWQAMLSDSLQRVIRKEVNTAFPDFELQKTELELLFKHMKYYFPKFQEPKVITMTNNVEYQNRIIVTDTLVLIGLDNYLGPEHEFYQGMSAYIAADFDKNLIVSDVAASLAKKVVSRPRDRSFLAQMIYYGKELYLKDQLMPALEDAKKINYSQNQLDWAKANEEPIWRNFIENEYLYSTDAKLGTRFLDPAPFSKFGLELDNDSPGRIGRYIGWQIVRAFMDKNSITLTQLLNLPADDIFKRSNYKPKR